MHSVTDALGHVSYLATAASPNNTYTIYGEPLSMVDPNGVTTILAYDTRGRLTNNTLKGVTGDTADRTTSFTYDADGKLTLTTKPLGNSTQLVYDSNNNLINTVLLDASSYTHDRLVTSFDGMSRVNGHMGQSCTVPGVGCTSWSTQYADTPPLTGLDQLMSLTYPAATGSTSFTYDVSGNTASSTIGDDSYSVTDTYTYDAQHNTVTHILGGSTLAYAYDLQFNRTVVSPSNAVATSYAYDDFGRIKKRVSPFTGSTTYQYDAAGNLTSKTDGNGATTATTYDALNRPLQAVSSRTGFSSETVTWTYDDTTSGHFGIGRLASMTDPSGSTTYTYERHGFLASQVQVAGGSTYTTSYAYDGNGNRSSVTLPSTRVLTYTFDYADRPESVVAGTTNYVTSAAYEPFGPLSQIVFGNGVTQTRTFTQRYLLAEDKVTNSTSTLADQTFVENAAGYITGITDAVNAGYDESMAYGGRATNMLTTVRTGSALWTLAQYSDTFNQNLSSIALPGGNLGLNYNRAGQLTSIYNQDTNTSQTVTEDGAGNELAVGSNSYTYSPRNLLSAGDGVTYHYDGFGRRVSATATAGTRVSLYDPSMHLQTESALSSGAIAYDYIWFAGIPVAQEDVGGTTHWTATDYRGAAYLQTNSSGAVYWQADYAPFGAVYALRTSDVHQPLRLPGQEAEEFATGNANGYTGRFYNGFRWYRPSIGRYTQADPLDYGNGAFSLYVYAANNPVNYGDALGLCGGLNWAQIAGYGALAIVGIGLGIVIGLAADYAIGAIAGAEASGLLAAGAAEAAEAGAAETAAEEISAVEDAAVGAGDAASGYETEADASGITVGYENGTGDVNVPAETIINDVTNDDTIETSYSEGNSGSQTISSTAIEENSRVSNAGTNGSYGAPGMPSADADVGRIGNPIDVPRGTNSPGSVDGIDYSGHAFDQMQARGLTPSVIQNTILNGIATVDRYGNQRFFDPINKVTTIVSSKTGKIITAWPGM